MCFLSVPVTILMPNPAKSGENKKERDFRPHYCTAPSRVFDHK